MDVVAPPAGDHPEAPLPRQPEPAKKPDKPAPAAKPPQPKQPKNGVGLAIFATMVIVVTLAALATYAYLQTNK